MRQLGIRELGQNEQRAAELLGSVWDDPELGGKLRAKAKEKYPDVKLPEDSVAPVLAPLQAQIKALTEKLEDRDKRDAEREKKESETSSAAKLQADVEAAVSKFNLTEEGRKAMLERMIAQGSTDADAAAALIAHAAPKPATAPKFMPQKINLYGSAESEEKYKLLHTRPDDFFDSEVTELLNDPEGYVRNAAA